MADYVIYQQAGETIVRNRCSNDLVLRNADAIPVLQEVADRLSVQGGGAVEIGSGIDRIEQPTGLPSMTTVRGSGRATVLKLLPAKSTITPGKG